MARSFLAATPYGALLPANPEALDRLIATVLARGVIFVGEVDGRLEAMLPLLAGRHPLSDACYAEELAWWVEPAWRHRLLGPRLLPRAEAWARAQGAVFLKMVAPADSSVGGFYLRHGYTAVETAYVKPLQREG